MVYPDYHGGSIVNLVSSILAHYGVSNIYKPLDDFALPPHKRLVFLVVDGMGMSFLQDHCQDSTLYSLTKRTMTSVFPSTTSAALTSLMTGVAPIQHGLTGWFMYFKEMATACLPLPFTPRYTDKNLTEQEVKIDDIFDFETIFQKIDRSMLLISPQATINSAFSSYCYRDKEKVGYDTIRQCFERIIGSVRTQSSALRPPHPEIIYAYIPHFDDIAHHHGINSPEAIRCFWEIDDLFAQTIQATKDTDTLYIVTADHGLVDTPPDRVLNIKDFPDLYECLILPLSGEPRVPYCYVRPAKYQQFVDIVDNQMKDYCTRYTLNDLLDKKVYGIGTPTPKVLNRIGDEMLVMKENYVMIDRVYHEQQKTFVGFHGGFHPDEMIVPLIVHR